MLYKVNPWNEDSDSSKLQQFLWLPVVVQLSEAVSSKLQENIKTIFFSL